MDLSAPVTPTTRVTGAHWEDRVLAHLQAAGLVLVAHNFSCRYGEIDLILRDRGALVFVEVRFRRDAAHGGGSISVGASKRLKLTRTAAVYLQQQPALAALPCRFDVVGCAGSLAAPLFDWTRAAFDAFD